MLLMDGWVWSISLLILGSRAKDCMNFFLIPSFPSAGEIFLARSSGSTRRLLEKCLIILNL